MNTVAENHLVFIANTVKNNPYVPGSSFALSEKLYCFGVLQNDGELAIKDATCDPKWQDNENLEDANTALCVLLENVETSKGEV